MGFCACGVTTAQPLDDECITRYRHWLQCGKAGEMDYLAADVEKRFYPKKKFPLAKSVIVLAMSFAPSQISTPNPCEGYICLYARGRDYHKVLKKRAEKLCTQMRDNFGTFDYKICVDTAPVAERSLAVRAGLGFVGKNCLLIIPGSGSMVVLCEIFCSLEIQSTQSDEKFSCGECRKCLDACPTNALNGLGELDASRCINALTIEYDGKIPQKIAEKMGGRIFGCDDCMLACPHNTAIAPGDEELRNNDFVAPQIKDVLNWTHDDWDSFTRGHSTRRARLEQFIRNAKIADDNIKS